MKQCICISLVSSLFLVDMVASHVQGQAPPTGKELLTFVAEQNKAAREKIQTYSYLADITWQSGQDKASHVYSGTAEVKRRGDYLWCIYRRQMLNKGEAQLQTKESRTVINDKYSATWDLVGSRHAMQNDHASVSAITSSVKTRLELMTPFDLLKRCFGDSDTPFPEAVIQNPQVKYDAVEAKDKAGNIVYQIRRFVPTMTDPSKPDVVWTLDPQKGFVTTEMTAYKENGETWVHELMQVEEAAKGVWFPVAYSEERTISRDPGNSTSSWRKVKLSKVQVNVEFPPDQFEVGALKLNKDLPDVILLRTGLDGHVTPYVYMGDTLVPQKIAREARSIEKSAMSRVSDQPTTYPHDQVAPPPGSVPGANPSGPSHRNLLILGGIGVLIAVIALMWGVRRKRNEIVK